MYTLLLCKEQIECNDISKLYNITVPVPKLPSMINGKVQINEEDNDVRTYGIFIYK